MAIAGPKIQAPSVLTPILQYTYGPDGKVDASSLSQEWAAFFHSLQQIAFGISRSGSSTERPTYKMDGRFKGLPFFDVSLGKPIWLKTPGTTDVWVDATGTPV